MNRSEGQALVVLDAGNTKTRAVAWPGSGGPGHPVEIVAVPTPGPAAPGSLAADLEAALEGRLDLPRVLASVAPHVTAALSGAWPGLLVVDHTWDLPFRLGVREPAAVGPDRLCNVAAAALAGLADALVVDIGTATTFDVLKAGTFLGGLIAPGPVTAAAGLTDRAARLAPVTFAPCPLAAGDDTGSALQRGSFHVAVAGIRGVIAGLLEAHGEMPVRLTGGAGRFLATESWPWDPDWTVRGAALLAERRLGP